MSASTELLVEEITEVEAQVAAARASGSRDLVLLTERLMELQKQLGIASKALNEGKKVLND